MSEPIAISSASATTINLGTYVVTGSLLGLDFTCLIAGCAGGLIALLFQREIVSRSRMVAMVITSSIVAGYGAIVIDKIAHNYFSSYTSVGDSKEFIALLTGIGANTLVPTIFKFIKDLNSSDGLISSVTKSVKTMFDYFFMDKK